MIKWHTGDKRWWRSPGYQKRDDIKEEVTTTHSMVKISVAPDVINIVRMAAEFGIDPSWDFLDIHPHLQEQLLNCRPTQAIKAEPVNAMDSPEASGIHEDSSTTGQETP
eukprot:8133493-Prorocentrum_lima.AAC.1